MGRISYQSQYNNFMEAEIIEKQQCPFGFRCKYFLSDRCRNQHNPNDKPMARVYERIQMRNTALVYMEGNKPRIFRGEGLPINFPLKEKLPSYCFFQAKCLKYNSPIQLKFQKLLGKFGDWETEQDILNRFCENIFPCSKYQQIPKKGKVKIHSDLEKRLEGDKLIMPSVLKNVKGRFLLGAQVTYIPVTQYRSGQLKSLQVVKIEFPDYGIMYGMLQFNQQGELVFIPRNIKMDTMIVQRMSKQVLKTFQLEYLSQKYSMFLPKPREKDELDKINKRFEDFLVCGVFLGWPEQSKMPIIALNEKILPNTVKNLKRAIVQESNIKTVNFSEKDQNQAKKALDKYNIKNLKKNLNALSSKILIITVEIDKGKLPDVGFSIEKTTDGIQIGIYVSDVSRLIGKDSQLNQTCRKQCLNIEDYNVQMLPPILEQKLLLQQDREMLLFGMTCYFNQNGNLDIRKTELKQTYGIINKNFTQDEANIILTDNYVTKNKQQETLRQFHRIMKLWNNFRRTDRFQSRLRSEEVIEYLTKTGCQIATMLWKLGLHKLKELNVTVKKNVIEQLNKCVIDVENFTQDIEQLNKIENQLKQRTNQQQIIIYQMETCIQSEAASIGINQISNIINNQTKEYKYKQMTISKPNLKKIQEFDQPMDESASIKVVCNVRQLQKTNKGRDTDISRKDISKPKHTIQQRRVTKVRDILEDGLLPQPEFDHNSTNNEKKERAGRAKHYMQNKLCILKPQWNSIQQIKDQFRQIIGSSTSQLHRQYFERMYILNRQHFHFIVELEREKKLQQEKRGRLFGEKFSKKQKELMLTDDKSIQEQNKSKPDKGNYTCKFKQRDAPKGNIRKYVIEQQIQSTNKKIKYKEKNSDETNNISKDKLSDRQQQFKPISYQQMQYQYIQYWHNWHNHPPMRQSYQAQFKKKMKQYDDCRLKKIRNKHKSQSQKIEALGQEISILSTRKVDMQKKLKEKLEKSHTTLQCVRRLLDERVVTPRAQIDNILDFYLELDKQANYQVANSPSFEQAVHYFTSKSKQYSEKEQNSNMNIMTMFEKVYKEDRLTWCRPVFDYYSLLCLRFLKENIQLFQIKSSGAVKYLSQVKRLERSHRELLQKRHLGGKSEVREANREVAKLNMYDNVRLNPKLTYKFLKIDIDTAFHPILGEVNMIKSRGSNSMIKLYDEFEGQILIIKHFPIHVQVQVIKK